MKTTKAGGRHNNTDDLRGVRPVGRDGEFLTTVNNIKFHFADPVPSGGQILSEAGFLPAGDHVLIQFLLHGTRSVGLDELVDLRQNGTEAFWAFKSDRVFRFTINDRGYEWGAAKITESKLRRIASVDDDEVLVLESASKDRVLADDDIVELGDFGTEHLHTGKRFVTVSLDEVEKKSRAASTRGKSLSAVWASKTDTCSMSSTRKASLSRCSRNRRSRSRVA